MGLWTRVQEWRSRSRVAKVDSYMRWTLYALPVVLPALGTAGVLADSALTRPWVLALGGIFTFQGILGISIFRRALDHYLWKKPAPWWPLGVQALLFVAAMVCMVVSFGAYGNEYASTIGLFLWNGSLSVFGPWILMVRKLRRFVIACISIALLLGLGVLALGSGWQAAASLTGSVLGLTLWCVYVVRLSGWMLHVMWELETAREAQARLAVAEERLRFGRDLHDVLGRNLAVIALKSELACQLARRGSDAALTQMTEVQRIAQESQREVREVVRGYREADLHTELVGARGVLSAADIDCRIDDTAGKTLPPPVQSVLAWVVREGTTNVLRHADARRCAVRLRVVADTEAVLIMENNGVREHDGGPGSGNGSGLAGLRERLTVLGGTLTYEHKAHATFRLTARVPLAGAGDAEDTAVTGNGGTA
ncbi:histidine kinase [Streptomyces rectiverticillatus]|uniref:sensor histidine kinase n=1 Tax=Streptomyces rectiverticillatus TaxID=173860 RepID=UPI001FE93A84|nr:histidine kinase [Streptomyces rectiverticillatus]QLE72776.1 histidine kinase [Streptomyces rectiverticillatus]